MTIYICRSVKNTTPLLISYDPGADSWFLLQLLTTKDTSLTNGEALEFMMSYSTPLMMLILI